METPVNIKTSLQIGEWVTSIDFKDAYIHIPIHTQSWKYLRFHVQGQSYQFWPVHSPCNGIHSSGEGGITDGFTQRYNNSPVPRRLVGQSQIPPSLSPACIDPSCLCRDLGWIVNIDKSELEHKQVFDFIGYQFDLREGRVRPTLECWQILSLKSRNYSTDWFVRLGS